MTKRNKLGLAVAAALSIGVAAQSAQAANIAHGGVGELAYVPYYSTVNGKQTYVRLTNNGFDTIVVKFAVREGRNSVDVRDFFIFLSPRDVWTGMVYSDGTAVRVATTDTSCTVPSKDRGGWKHGLFGENNFTDRLDRDNTVIPNDGWSVKVARYADGSYPQEGYIDIRVVGTSANNPNNRLGDYDPVRFVQHDGRTLQNESGAAISVPNDCHAVSAAFDIRQGNTAELRDPNLFAFLKTQYTEPTNALSAVGVIVDPAAGKLTEMPVTVVANLVNPGAGGVDGASGFLDDTTAINDIIEPIARDGEAGIQFTAPLVATIFDDFAGQARSYETASGSDTLSAALMTSSISGYIDSTGSNSWIVNFPTKRLHQRGGVCDAPFPANCSVNISNVVHSVTNIGEATYITNEEESQFTSQVGNTICFSGSDIGQNTLDVDSCAPEAQPNDVELPTEVTLVTLGSGNPLASSLNVGIDSAALNANNLIGWMQMRFTNSQDLLVRDAANNNVTLNGLPAIGFSYKEYGPTMTLPQEYTYSFPR